METGHQAFVIIHIHVGHVLDVVVGMAAAPGRDASGVSLQHVVDDGQIVRREVPHDVDVVLEQPQVDPDAVDVIQFAKLPAGNDLLDEPDGVAEEISVVDHEHPLVPGSQFDEGLGFRDACSQRLLHEYMQARFEAPLRDWEMGRHGSRDRHGIQR